MCIQNIMCIQNNMTHWRAGASNIHTYRISFILSLHNAHKQTRSQSRRSRRMRVRFSRVVCARFCRIDQRSRTNTSWNICTRIHEQEKTNKSIRARRRTRERARERSEEWKPMEKIQLGNVSCGLEPCACCCVCCAPVFCSLVRSHGIIIMCVCVHSYGKRTRNSYFRTPDAAQHTSTEKQTHARTQRIGCWRIALGECDCMHSLSVAQHAFICPTFCMMLPLFDSRNARILLCSRV